MEIYLMRHGETEWNRERRFQGQLDSALTPRGIAQAESCGRWLAAQVGDAATITASPLGRTRQTSEIVRRFGAYPETQWDWRIAEVSFGAWEGLTQEDIDAGWPTALDGASPGNWYFRAPGGERYDMAVARISHWLREVEGTVIAISHGLAGRLIRGAYLSLDEDEALALPVPHDTIWRLAEGQIVKITP